MLYLIYDVATEYEKRFWDLEVMKDHDLNLHSNDFKDICGYYSLLGAGISRTLSDIEIENTYKVYCRQYRKDTLKFHPNKNHRRPDSRSKYHKFNYNHDKSVKAYYAFNTDGPMYLGIITYDR